MQELRTTVIKPLPPTRGEPVEFASEHVAIPTDEPCRAVVVEILRGEWLPSRARTHARTHAPMHAPTHAPRLVLPLAMAMNVIMVTTE